MKNRIIKLKQQGFTIVEVMIVVGIIGVIAAIAIPVYSDYMNRAKVAEAAQLLGGLRMPMQEYYGSWGRWPTIASIQGRDTGNYVSKIVSGGAAPDFYVEATMRGDNTQVGPYGKQLRMVFNEEQNEWTCTTNGTAQPIPHQYLPSPCKDIH
jgi:type IV pilus assembly protein PilA